MGTAGKLMSNKVSHRRQSPHAMSVEPELAQLLPALFTKASVRNCIRFAIMVIVLLTSYVLFYFSSWYTLPLLWFIAGTSLFGLSVTAHACADGNFTTNSLANHIVGWIALLPVLGSFESLSVTRDIAESKVSTQKLNRTIDVLGSTTYLWALSSYVAWLQQTTVSWCKKRIVANNVLVIAFALIMISSILYIGGLSAFFKYWLAPWVVYHIWCSTSIKIKLSMRVEFQVMQDHVDHYRNTLKSVADQVPSDLIPSVTYIIERANHSYGRGFAMLESLFGHETFHDKLVGSTLMSVKNCKSSKLAPSNSLSEILGQRLHLTEPHIAAWILCSPIIALFGLLTTDWHSSTLWTAFGFYWIGGIGISAGYHRLFSHRSYDAVAPVKWLLAAMGTSAFEGSILSWCRDHRVHHRHSDTTLDPYNINRGFFFAHMGWLLTPRDENCAAAVKKVDVSDLEAIWWIRAQHNYFGFFSILLGIILPTTICGLGWGDWRGGFFIAAMTKSCFLQHCTFFINSLAHTWGEATYSDQRTPRDSTLVALLTFGEGNHNSHHEFPFDYRNGLLWWNFDPPKWILAFLEAFGLCYDLKRFDQNTIKKGNLAMRLKKIEEEHSRYSWGPREDELPRMTMAEVKKRCSRTPGDMKGERLIVIDGIIHDVSQFEASHPGGVGLLRIYISRDASRAFNGSTNDLHSYNHSIAARHILRTMRVAVLEPDSKDVSGSST